MMSDRIDETTTYTASVNVNDGTDNKSASISTDDINELARFLELAGVKSATNNAIPTLSSCGTCGEGWADDNPVNMAAAGFKIGGPASEIEVEMPCEEVNQASHDYTYNDSDGEPFSMDVHDYKGRSEHFPGGDDYRRVNHYGDNALPQNEELEVENEHGEITHQIPSQTIRDMPHGFIDGLEAEYGNTVAYQMKDLAGTGSLELQNPNALKLIAQYARNVGYLSLWEDISEYFDMIGETMPLESVNDGVARLQKLAGMPITEYNTNEGDIQEGQYVKIDPSVGGGYGQVKELSPSGKWATVEIVGEGEYDIDDEAGMPDLTGETMHFSLSDLLPLESYDAMIDMIDSEKTMQQEGYTARELTDHDKEWLSKTIPGLEGPFRNRADGRYYYYDPKEGRYYDSTTDMYMDRDFVLEAGELMSELTRLKELSGIHEAPMADPHGGAMISPYNDELDSPEVDDMYANVQDEAATIIDSLYSDVLANTETFLKHYDMEDLESLASEIASDAISKASNVYGDGDEYNDYVEHADIEAFVLKIMKKRLGLTEGSGATRDNEKENKMIAHLDRQGKKPEKFKPHEKKTADDKYSALAKKYGVKEDATVAELELKLLEEYNSFSDKF
ncbi:MAG: hypothetical protein HC836_32825 [Richelia sp. RM2_1_2]|nr:hypothetical protein [Richelia sp. RM2_1_2]